MKCKQLIYRLTLSFFATGLLIGAAGSADSLSMPTIETEKRNEQHIVVADYAEIVIDIGTETDLKRYMKNNVPEENIKILMEPKIRMYLNKELFSDFKNWKLVKLSNDAYQFKHNTWSGFFLQVNIKEPAVYRIKNTEIGHLDGAMENLNVFDIRENENGDWVIHLPRPYINLDEQQGNSYLVWQELKLTEANDFMVRKIDDRTFQLNYRHWSSIFWEIDFREKSVWRIYNGVFGQPGGSRYAIEDMHPLAPHDQLSRHAGTAQLKRDEQGTSSQSVSALWPVDITMDGLNDYPSSQWLTGQAELFQDTLTSKHYDTLLLPLQVDGYALDRAGRLLITLMIHQRLLESGCSLPNPILVSRALGEEKRTLSQDRVFRLAAQLKAKEIIVPMAGHNNRNQLKVTFLKLTADDNGQFTINGKILRTEKNNIPFTDTNPPILAVAPLLDELLLGINTKPAPRTPTNTKRLKPPTSLPNPPADLFAATGASPLERVLSLQLIGMLHPNSSIARDGLFGRSLIAAWNLPPKDPNRRLLVARALFYLQLRPAAVEVLGKPGTPEEQALLAYLNGDLASLEKSLGKIKSPLPRLMADLEYQDLRIDYTGKPLDEQALAAIVQPFPGWEPLIVRKLLDKWPWMTQSNLVVKELMDQAFPIAGFTAQGLVSSRVTLGESPLESSEIDLCAYEHYRRILIKDGANLYGNSNILDVNASDFLQLLYDTSEANLVNDVYKSVRMRGLADEALEKIRKYEPIYKGLPSLTYLESEALNLKSRNSRGAEQSEYSKQAKQLKSLSSYWSMGQVPFAYSRAFDFDFPKRYYWHANNAESISSLENSLLYTNEKFNIVKGLYKFYEGTGYEKQLQDLLARLESRFVGHPDRQILLADYYAIKGDTERSEKYLQQAVKVLPDAWEPHSKLIDIAIHNGQIDKAFKLASNFQPFAEKKPSNSVGLSRDAYRAAMKFYLLGETDKALPLFELAQKFETGSAAEMSSAAYASLAKGDYQKAGFDYLNGARRYASSEFLSGYLELLHLVGLHDQAWALFNNLPADNKSPDVYGAALFGMRIEGKTDKELMDWIGQQGQSSGVTGFYLHKIIGSNKAQLEEIFDKGIPKPKNGQLSLDARQSFMQTYLAHRIEDYERGNKSLLFVRNGDNIFKTDLPYAPYYYYNSGKIDKFRLLLSEYREKKGVNYFELLAEGIVAGLDGNHQKAQSLFRKARLNISIDDTYHLPPMYQIAETCEWFFEKTNEPTYLDSALEYARWHIRQDPIAAWPHTFLAKYASTESERLQALGRAVFLAPDSDRISGYSWEEKQRALKIFKENNIYTKQHSKAGNSSI